MWVRFTADFDWKPLRQVTIAYRKGQVVNVRHACAEEAIAVGKAVATDKTGKDCSDAGD